MDNKDIDFVARRYRKGKFSVQAGWRRLGIGASVRTFRYRVAAAVAATVILSATAAIGYRETHSVDSVKPDQPVPVQAVSPLAQVKVIDFENAPLPEVVKKIESTYSVKVKKLPESPQDYKLSLHYEGTPKDLIQVINEILGTKMTVAEK